MHERPSAPTGDWLEQSCPVCEHDHEPYVIAETPALYYPPEAPGHGGFVCEGPTFFWCVRSGRMFAYWAGNESYLALLRPDEDDPLFAQEAS